MKARTSLSRTIHPLLSLLAGLGLLFAATNLAAQDQPQDYPPESPDDAIQLEREELPPIQEPSPVDPGSIDMDQPTNDPADNSQNLEINTAVDSFSQFVTSFQRDQAYKTYTNTYSIRGLRSLTDTLGAMIRPEDEQLMQSQKTLYNQVVTIETMSANERDAQPNLVSNALIDAATLFVNVQRQYYPDYDKQAQEIARLAASIAPDSPIKEQTDKLNQFFLTASTTLEQMAQQPINSIGGGPLDNPGQQTQNTPNIDPNVDPNVDPNLTPPFDPNVDPNVSGDTDRDYDEDDDDDDIYDNNQYDNNDNDEPDNAYPNTPGTQPFDPDPLNPTYPVSPSEPLDPTDPMEPTPLGPAQPFDATNPEESAPLDF